MLQKYQYENRPEYIHRKNRESLEAKGVAVSMPEPVISAQEPRPPSSKKPRRTGSVEPIGEFVYGEIMSDGECMSSGQEI